jgi:hypothetical protein
MPWLAILEPVEVFCANSVFATQVPSPSHNRISIDEHHDLAQQFTPHAVFPDGVHTPCPSAPSPSSGGMDHVSPLGAYHHPSKGQLGPNQWSKEAIGQSLMKDSWSSSLSSSAPFSSRTNKEEFVAWPANLRSTFPIVSQSYVLHLYIRTFTTCGPRNSLLAVARVPMRGSFVIGSRDQAHE